MYFCSVQHISSCIIRNTRSKYNVSASDVIVLRSMRSGGSECLRGLISWITPSGGWSRGTEWLRWMLKRGHEHREVSLPVVSTKQGSVCLEINSTDCTACVGAGVFPSSPTSAFCFPLGSRVPWRHQRERRHTAYSVTQTWRNPTKMSRDVRVGQVRASL